MEKVCLSVCGLSLFVGSSCASKRRPAGPAQPLSKFPCCLYFPVGGRAAGRTCQIAAARLHREMDGEKDREIDKEIDKEK